MTDSRSTLLLRPPQRVQNESPPECRVLLGGGNKLFRPRNSGRMTVRLGGIGPWSYPIHPHKSVGLRLRNGPWKGTLYRRPYGIH